ncbi:MAG: hypothetical protein M3137_16540 [Actinomycetota bacterium]|nr:hypothetical protein [Actinomycetota bacterium]
MVLNDASFLHAALASVYDFISGATVITRYDRDRNGRAVEPEGLVDLVLSRSIDPDRKVNLIVTNEGQEPMARNRAMDYAGAPTRLRVTPGSPPSIPAPDLYWHVDADEVYDATDVGRLLDFVDQHRAQAYRLELRTYFRTWNWRVEERGSFTALTRPGFRFGWMRDVYPTIWRRGWAKAARTGLVSEASAWRRSGVVLVPPEVAVCHHGSYVGDRERIADKIDRSSHRTQMVDGWLERVWDTWTPQATNFHPTHPPRFPRAVHVATAELPQAIRNSSWPDGFIEAPAAIDPQGSPGFSTKTR